MAICLKVIEDINNRIKRPAQLTASPAYPGQVGNNLESLPRLSGPLKEGNILTNPSPSRNTSEMLASSIGSFAKNAGQSPNAKNPLIALSPRAKQLALTARNTILTPEQQKLISSDNAKSSINVYLTQFLNSPVGLPFRQTFERRLCITVLGTPYSELSVALNAIDSLTALAVSSLIDDQYGRVSKDIPRIVREYVMTIININSLSSSLAPHWTDVAFDAKSEVARGSEEVDLLVEHLKIGLAELLTAFAEHIVNLGLSHVELRRARQVAGLVAP